MAQEPTPDASVVIPAYNPGDFLLRALDSVRAQDGTDWECIVVDDGGAEDLAWVDAYDHRVRRIKQRNAGVSVARNVAAANARAPFVAYLDQDDEWRPGKLAAQLEAIADSGDLCWTAFTWDFGTHELAGSVREESYRSFLADGHLCLSTLMVRREWLERVGGFNPLHKVQQDYDLCLRLFAAGARGVSVPKDLARYRLHEENVSRDYLTAYRERMNVLEGHRNAALADDQDDVAAAATRGMARTRELYGGQALTMFRETRAPAHLMRAARWNPLHVGQSLVTFARKRIGPRGDRA